MKKLLFVTILLLLSKITFTQNNAFELKNFHPDSTQQELRDLFQEFRLKHPGFYRYNNAITFDQKIDSIITSIKKPVNELEIYRLIKPIFAEIGCLHTGISLSEKTETLLDVQPNCLPFLLLHKQGKAYIWKNYSKHQEIKIGSEITKINGQSIESIYQKLLQNIPMDGFNKTGKFKLLEYSFPTWYRNIIEITTDFSIELKSNNSSEETFTFSTKGIKANQLPSYQDMISKKLNLKIEGDIAILTIPSFSNSYHKANSQKFKKEIKQYFKKIKKEKIKNLIVDFRGNTGGSDSNAALFVSHFFEKPFRYWDRIEVSEPIAKDIKGFNRLFYAKPEKQDSIWLWKKSPLFTSEFDFYKKQKPAKNIFQGDTFFLIDGLCMSSCADAAAILSFNKKATFIGQETGGGFQGNTSGLIPESQLSSGLIFSIPLLKYINAVDPTINFGRGTIPDIEVESSPLYNLNGKDATLEMAFDIIKNIPIPSH
ncbi:MAG: S41 family peptidase [Saprospiraceae bacterium]